MSQVHYTTKTEPYRWAKSLLQDSPQWQQLNEPVEQKLVLAKTNQGWVHALKLRR